MSTATVSWALVEAVHLLDPGRASLAEVSLSEATQLSEAEDAEEE